MTPRPSQRTLLHRTDSWTEFLKGRYFQWLGRLFVFLLLFPVYTKWPYVLAMTNWIFILIGLLSHNYKLRSLRRWWRRQQRWRRWLRAWWWRWCYWCWWWLLLSFSDKYQFMDELPGYLKQLSKDGEISRIVKHKNISRNEDWQRVIEKHRDYELNIMKQNFSSEDFLTAMSDFVYKRKWRWLRRHYLPIMTIK